MESRKWSSPSSDSLSRPSCNGFPPSVEAQDLEGVALLRQIFPEESIENLRRLHEQRILNAAIRKDGERRRNDKHELDYGHVHESKQESINSCGEMQEKKQEEILPVDFLRLPSDVAVRRYNSKLGKWQYQLVVDLERRLFVQYKRHFRGNWSEESFYTTVLERHPRFGLGITLTQRSATVLVYALSSDGKIDNQSIGVGDVLLGVNGYSLFEIAMKQNTLLRQTVAFLKSCPSPVVLHLKRAPGKKTENQSPYRSASSPGVSLLDTTLNESFQSEDSFHSDKKQIQPLIHPLAKVLASRGLIKNAVDEQRATEELCRFTERARQWEFSNSFRIDSADNFKLLPTFHILENDTIYSCPGIVHQPHPSGRLHKHSTPGSVSSETSTGEYSVLSAGSRSTYPGYKSTKATDYLNEMSSHIFIPLMGVRKALSVRILNSFLDGEQTAYTIWVQDIESGRGWYAPLRYLRDFEDLRAATMSLRTKISEVPFPSHGWFSFGYNKAKESDTARDEKCRQLERFLRTLCTMIYTDQLHPSVAEVAIHVQSFLGCDNVLQSGTDGSGLSFAMSPSSLMCDGAKHSESQMHARMLLKRDLQMYTNRIFLLDPVAKLVSHFVDSARANSPSLKDIETMQAQSSKTLKKRATDELQKVQAVVDQLQNMLLEGCADDFKAIGQSGKFSELNYFINGINGESYWEKLVREAVREQVEIEVYTPIRAGLSRLLVNAWRHEDMAVSFKVQELRKRPQDFFRIPSNESNWESVSKLLKNVSMCALPCAKLRAIVDAASEISRLHQAQSNIESQGKETSTSKGESKLLSADDFLPIFIYCVIRAEMERPCALCALLRSLCDPINRMGEVGYYLASFEAAIAHISEMDLSSHEEMFSFLSIPLSEESFD